MKVSTDFRPLAKQRVVRALSNSELFWIWLCVNVAFLLGWFLLPVLEYLGLVPRVW